MNKLLISVLSACVIALPAFADEEEGQSVVERTDCPAVQEQIKELSAIDEPDEETAAELADLQAEYRRNCSRRAGKRRTSASRAAVMEQRAALAEAAAVAQEDVADEAAPDTAVAASVESATKSGDAAATVDTVAAAAPAPELTDEQRAENVANGLCPTGEKPNKFGCCGTAKFKDLGNSKFGCCESDFDLTNCSEPIGVLK